MGIQTTGPRGVTKWRLRNDQEVIKGDLSHNFVSGVGILPVLASSGFPGEDIRMYHETLT